MCDRSLSRLSRFIVRDLEASKAQKAAETTGKTQRSRLLRDRKARETKA